MSPTPPDAQIALLRPSLRVAGRMRTAFLGIAAAGVILAWFLWNPIPLMFAAFFAAVGLADHRVGPNTVAALRAYDTGTPTTGALFVTITTWDMDQHYQARVREAGHPDWIYEFVPQGWTPEARSYPARIWRDAVNRAPVLAVVDAGIAIPRGVPQPATEEGVSRCN